MCSWLSWSPNASASDFTEDYWQKTPSDHVCPTQFERLPPPRFVPKTNADSKFVVRSDQFLETDSGDRYFSGNVKVQQDDLLLTAPSLEWLKEGPLQFEEGLSLYHDQGAMAIDEATFDLDTSSQAVQLDDLSWVIFDFALQGALDSLEGDETRVKATGLRFSGCDPRTERWGIRVNKININRETSRVSVRGLRFYIANVPVFYLPYFAFRPQPVRNGFATTHFSYRSDNGIIVAQPIRFFGDFGLVELEPRYLAKNGFQMGAKVNVLDIASTIDWVPHDKKLDQRTTSTIDPSRWRIQVNYDKPWRAVQAHISFTQPSDFAYQHDFEFDSLMQPQFSTTNTASLHYSSRDWAVDFISQRFNSTSANRLLGERYPELDVRWQPQWGALGAATQVNIAHYRNAHLQLHREHIEQSLSVDLKRAWGELTLGATETLTRFSIDQREIERAFSRRLHTFQIGAGLFFDKLAPTSVRTVEPRLFYIDRTFTSPDLPALFDQPRSPLHTSQIFGESRTSGLDDIPGQRRLAVGFRFHALPFTDKAEVVRAELAHTTHLDGLDGQSPSTHGWAASMRVQRNNGIAVEHRQYLERNHPHRNQFTTLLVYEPTPSKALYASIGRRTQHAIEQMELGFRWPLSTRWETIGAFGYDKHHKQITDTHLGVAYAGCCYRTMLFMQRTIDWDFAGDQYRVELENRVMLRFELAGLGIVGRNRIESLIERKRFGFR